MEYTIISILLGLCVIYPTTDGKSSIERKNAAGAGLIGESLYLIHNLSENIQSEPFLIAGSFRVNLAIDLEHPKDLGECSGSFMIIICWPYLLHNSSMWA